MLFFAFLFTSATASLAMVNVGNGSVNVGGDVSVGAGGINAGGISVKNMFSDVSETNQHRNAIQYLKKHSVFEGYSDGRFMPDNSINRAELMKILVVGQGIDVDSEEYKDCFPDVEEQWFSPYVCYAKEQDWVAGYPDGTFRPAKPVNNAEAAKMMLNSLDVSLKDAGENFSDVDESAWFARFAKTMRQRNLLGISSFQAARGMTRAEIAEMLYRILVIKQVSDESYTDESVTEFDADQPIELITFTNRTADVVAEALSKAKELMDEGIEATIEDEHEEALKAFNRAAYNTPNSPRAWAAKAYAHYNLEETKSALYAANRAISLNQRMPFGLLVKSVILYEKEMPTRAEAALKHALMIRKKLGVEETLPSAEEIANYTSEELIDMIVEAIETSAEEAMEMDAEPWTDELDKEDDEDMEDYEYDEDEELAGEDDEDEEDDSTDEEDSEDDSDDDSTDDEDSEEDDSDDDSTEEDSSTES